MTTLQQDFETTRERLRQGLGNADANDLLAACSETHWSSDNHKVSPFDCLREGWELARKHFGAAQLFGVQLAGHEGATDHFVVVGLDEADAVLRFQEKLAAVLAAEGLEL